MVDAEMIFKGVGTIIAAVVTGNLVWSKNPKHVVVAIGAPGGFVTAHVFRLRVGYAGAQAFYFFGTFFLCHFIPLFPKNLLNEK